MMKAYQRGVSINFFQLDEFPGYSGLGQVILCIQACFGKGCANGIKRIVGIANRKPRRARKKRKREKVVQ